ncbi:MAG: site-specific integrase [Gudongella oleilytica]|nr:site-specific integrase [Gudongella oleilytica]
MEITKKVQPIRDKEMIEKMKNELLKRGYRDYMLFVIGINTGLRISDILKLKVSDVKDRSHIILNEKKTGKSKKARINEQLNRDIDGYVQGMPLQAYLFESQRGANNPITRVQAYRILNAAAKEIGLDEIGTHTLRKTFGYWHYKQYKDVALLQKLFNHSSPSITLEYIGSNQDIMDQTIDNFYI